MRNLPRRCCASFYFSAIEMNHSASGKQISADKDVIYCWPDSLWPTGRGLLIVGELEVTNDT